MEEGVGKIDSDVEKFTGSTLSSIDGLRIQNSDNARETRDKIVEVSTRTQTEIESMKNEVVLLQAKIKQQRGWSIISALFALAAAAAATSPYWLKLITG